MIKKMEDSLYKVAIITGGIGSERAVSLRSAQALAAACRLIGIDPIILDATSQGYTLIDGASILSEEELVQLLQKECYLVFPIIHGACGEDGILRRLLESSGVTCIGAPSQALVLTVDKQTTGDFLTLQWIVTPRSLVIERTAFGIDPEGVLDQIDQLGYPCIIKPRNEGSSILLSRANSREECFTSLLYGLREKWELLVQEQIIGREFTCGVIEIDGAIRALPPTEIILDTGTLFSYDAKYTAGACQEITPARIDAVTTHALQDIALQVHELTGMVDISRTDMILRANGQIVVLEINSIPGLTVTSFIPAQLKAAWYDLGDWVREMVGKYQGKI
jgi:D-alanine-D-alanine ligase